MKTLLESLPGLARHSPRESLKTVFVTEELRGNDDILKD